MFGNLLTATAVIAIIWIGCFVFYLYTSRQQASLAAEVEKVKEQLDEMPEQDD